VTDPTFLADVVLRLLSYAEVGGTGSPGRLAKLVGARFAADPEVIRWLGAVRAGHGSAGEVLDLFSAVRLRVETDPVFREEVRRLVVAAYADPAIVPMLPDPSPGL
jgi:hypothetical protein